MDFFERDLGKILKANALEQRRSFLKTESDCGRVYDRNLEQFPVTIDLYGAYARITDYSQTQLSEQLVESVCDICRRMLYIEKDKVIFQRRPKRSDGEQHEIQDVTPLWVDVKENALKFKVDLTSHIDTGLFLDQVNNRKMIEEQCLGLDVLNLFSYTGSFSVYAAHGGAKSVTSVDLSNTYTQWASENLRNNGFTGDSYKCICSDAKDFVLEAIKAKDKYDIIIFDPPCFSNSRKMDYDFDVQRDYVSWLTLLCRILRKSGFVLFSTNLATFGMDGNIRRRSKIKEITSETKALGFTSRVGSSRSWILEKDEEKLTLDWDDSAPVVKKSTKRVSKAKIAAEPVENTETAETVETKEKAVEEKETVEAQVVEPAEEKVETSEASEENVEEEADEMEFGKNEYKEADEKPNYRERSDRPSYRDRGDRPSYRDRGDRPSYRDRDSRPSYGRDRDDRPSYGRDRDSRPSYGRDRDDRPSYGRDRDSRPSYGRDRDSRPSYGRDRDDRPSFRSRDDRDSRPSYGRDRDSRPSYGRDRDDRPSFRSRDDRDSRPSYGRDRDSRPSYGRDRDDRPSFRSHDDRDSRPSYGRDRDDRPSFRSRDDRDSKPSFRDRDSRPSFRSRDDRDSRPSFRGKGSDAKKPYGYDSFKPARDRNDSKQFFWLDEDDSKEDK